MLFVLFSFVLLVHIINSPPSTGEYKARLVYPASPMARAIGSHAMCDFLCGTCCACCCCEISSIEKSGVYIEYVSVIHQGVGQTYFLF